MGSLSRFAVIGATTGLVVPFAFLGIARITQTGSLSTPQIRYWVENVMLMLWPSSIMNMPFAEISVVALSLSVAINALAYAALGASFYGFWHRRSFASLTFPIAFVAIGLLLVFS